MVKRLAVLVSGSGTILEAILDSGIVVDLVVSDRPCRAIKIALEKDIAAQIVLRDDFTSGFDREAYAAILTQVLLDHKIDVVAMAGFGTVLGETIFKFYENRILNTHPSLLPSYKGWHAVRDALEAGEKKTGCTVHVATLGVDEGPIIAQETVDIHDNDNEEILHERIKSLERTLYPQAIKSFLDNLDNN